MNNIVKSVLICVFFCSIYAIPPVFEDAGYIKDGGQDITGLDHGSPYVVDFDGDGKKDLLIGTGAGNIRYYQNKGSDAQPTFSGYTIVKADGSAITCSGSWCGAAIVAGCDLNEDGYEDLFVGEALGDNKIRLYLGKENGLTFEENLSASGGDIVGNSYMLGVSTDWNEDGKKDIIASSAYKFPGTNGAIKIFLNEGTNSSPELDAGSFLSPGGAPFADVRNYCYAGDLNNDGKKDVIIGVNGGYDPPAGILFFENVGENNNPAFESDFVQIKPGFTGDELIARPCLSDWDNDGDIDMIYCDDGNKVQFFRNDTPTGISTKNYAINSHNFAIVAFSKTGTIVIDYTLQKGANIKIGVYMANGQLTTCLINQYQGSGNHKFIWNVSGSSRNSLSAGVYFVNFQVGNTLNSRKIVITQ